MLIIYNTLFFRRIKWSTSKGRSKALQPYKYALKSNLNALEQMVTILVINIVFRYVQTQNKYSDGNYLTLDLVK